jgi:hypothetical protein
MRRRRDRKIGPEIDDHRPARREDAVPRWTGRLRRINEGAFQPGRLREPVTGYIGNGLRRLDSGIAFHHALLHVA